MDLRGLARNMDAFVRVVSLALAAAMLLTVLGAAHDVATPTGFVLRPAAPAEGIPAASDGTAVVPDCGAPVRAIEARETPGGGYKLPRGPAVVTAAQPERPTPPTPEPAIVEEAAPPGTLRPHDGHPGPVLRSLVTARSAPHKPTGPPAA
jgi:hypothetical protein